MPKLLDRLFRREKQLSMSPAFVEGLQSLAPMPFLPLYGATVQEAMTGDYGALYRSQPAVRIVIDFLAKNVAQLNIKAFRKSNGSPEELRDHPANTLLHDPNPDMTLYDLLLSTVSALGVYENAFWWLVQQGTARQIRFVPPETVRVLGNPHVGPSGYRVLLDQNDRRDITLSPDQVVHFKTWNPFDMRVGVSKLEGLRAVLRDDALASWARAATWRNAAWMQNVVERPVDAPVLEGDNLKRHREDWQNQFAGPSNAGKTIFAEEGETMNWGPERRPWDTEYVAGRKATLEEAARSYHIPLSMLGLMSNANYKATSEEHKVLYADVLGSWLTMMKQRLVLSYLRWFDDIEGVYFEFNLKEKLRGSFEEEAQVLTQSVGGPWLLRNEVRAMQDLPPVPGGDELIVPLNVALGGQPNPATPTETPAGPLYGSNSKALPRGKAIDPTLKIRRASAKAHETMLREFFTRQGKAVLSRAGAKAAGGIDEVFDQERWDRELRLNLIPLAMKTALAAGKQTAQHVRGTYDESRTLNYIEETSRIAAEGINKATRDDVESVLDDGQALRDLFAGPLLSRAGTVALSRATTMTAFGVHEAAAQSGLRSKTWIVTSQNSRHPELDGESVGLGETFSNGAQYPGDPSLPADQAAGCECLLEVG